MPPGMGYTMKRWLLCLAVFALFSNAALASEKMKADDIWEKSLFQSPGNVESSFQADHDAFAPIPFEVASRTSGSAAPNVYLFRGLLGVFSTGLDTLAQKLRAKGVSVKVMSHAAAGQALAEIEREYARQRKKGRRHRVVLVGHSLGANAALATAARLGSKKIPVSLVVTIDGTHNRPVVGSVGRYLNYHTTDAGVNGPLIKPAGSVGRKVTNIYVKGRKESDVRSLNHFNIEKNPRIQAELVRAITRVVPKQRRRS